MHKHGCCLEDAAQGKLLLHVYLLPISPVLVPGKLWGWLAGITSLLHTGTWPCTGDRWSHHSVGMGWSWRWLQHPDSGKEVPQSNAGGELWGHVHPALIPCSFPISKPHCCCTALCLLGYHLVIEVTSGNHLQSLSGPTPSCWALLCAGQNLHLTLTSSGCCSCCPKWG